MDEIISIVERLEALGFAPRDIVAAVRARAERERAERDEWCDEEERRQEYEERHGYPVPY